MEEALSFCTQTTCNNSGSKSISPTDPCSSPEGVPPALVGDEVVVPGGAEGVVVGEGVVAPPEPGSDVVGEDHVNGVVTSG